MVTVHSPSSDAALLQRSISATLWKIRKATIDRDAVTTHRYEQEMEQLLDHLAGCLITAEEAEFVS